MDDNGSRYNQINLALSVRLDAVRTERYSLITARRSQREAYRSARTWEHPHRKRWRKNRENDSTLPGNEPRIRLSG